VLDTLLSSSSASLDERVESAGVLAQITSPWIADNHKIAGLDKHVPSMVGSLTSMNSISMRMSWITIDFSDLARLNNGEESFLLVTAALANLTFMSPVTSSSLQLCNSAGALIKAVKNAPGTSLFAQDQVVTVLANMAASPACRPDLRAVDGVRFLLTILGEADPTRTSSAAEAAAAERVQKKSAIALSRLCNDAQVCFDVVRFGQRGIGRIAELCRRADLRNDSDAVLVACLAVLRRVAGNLGGDVGADVEDLIRPKLVDSFVECSSRTGDGNNGQHESYV